MLESRDLSATLVLPPQEQGETAANDRPATDSNPYVGPRPFTPSESHLFFGRDAEASKILSLIVAHPVLLLYAPSGAGKTSLLYAKVIPMLKERACEVIGPARVSATVIRAADSPTDNVFIRAALSSLRERTASAQDSAPSFRELLTTPTEREEPVEGVKPLRVVIFDQFEEIFTSAPHRWPDRSAFFEELGMALDEDPRLRVVFSMREEFIARMEPYAAMLPERLRTRTRIERLREALALLAVTGPVEGTGRSFGPGAAEKLVAHLRGASVSASSPTSAGTAEFVDPLHLQLVCTRLWDSLPAATREIDASLVQKHGDLDDALESYFDTALAKVSQRVSIPEGRLRRWFESSLITVAGTRAIVFREAEVTAGMPNHVVELLDEMYLVRSEIRGDDLWYELAHDRFVLPITRANARWRNAHQGERVRGDQLEAAAKEWVLRGRPKTLHLRADESWAAAEWLKSNEAEEFGVTETLREYVQASQAAATARRLYRRLAALAIVISIAAVVGVAFFSRSAESAENAKWEAWGEVATQMASDPGKEFAALAWGVRAVGEALAEGERPPPAAVSGLREATKVVGGTRWLRGGTGDPRGGALSPNGALAVIVDMDTVRLFNAQTGRLLAARGADTAYDWATAQFAESGRTLVAMQRAEPRGPAAAAVSEQRYWVADAATGRELSAITRRLSGGSLATFARLSGTAVVYGRRRAAEVYDVRGGFRRQFRGVSTGWLWATLSPSGSHLVALRDDSFQIWDVSTGMMLLERPRSGPGTATFSPDGTYVLILRTSTGAGIQLWALPDKADSLPQGRDDKPVMVREQDLPVYPFEVPQFTRQGSAVIVAGMDTIGRQKVVLLELAGQQRWRDLGDPDTARLHLVGGRVVHIRSVAGEQRVTVVDPQSPDTIAEVGVRQEVADISIDDAGRFFLTLTRDNSARIWPLGIDEAPTVATARELVVNGCRKLRGEKEYTPAVAQICREF